MTDEQQESNESLLDEPPDIGPIPNQLLLTCYPQIAPICPQLLLPFYYLCPISSGQSFRFFVSN